MAVWEQDKSYWWWENGFLCQIRNLDFSKKIISQIFQLRENPLLNIAEVIYVKCAFFFFFELGSISHGISFWRGKWFKKDCTAKGTFWEM